MKDYVNKTKEDLTTMLTEKRKALREFRFGSAGSKTRNVKAGENIRKNIARILTVINSPTNNPGSNGQVSNGRNFK